MKFKILAIIVILLALMGGCRVASGATINEELKALLMSRTPPDIVIINPEGRKPAFIPHKEHMKLDCNICHFDAVSSIKQRKYSHVMCLNCHYDNIAKRIITDTPVIKPVSCGSCHASWIEDYQLNEK